MKFPMAAAPPTRRATAGVTFGSVSSVLMRSLSPFELGDGLPGKRLPQSAARREPGLRGVALDDRGALGVGQDGIDVLEAVGRQALHCVDDALRASGAVRAHDRGGPRQPILLVAAQRRRGIVADRELLGERDGIEY